MFPYSTQRARLLSVESIPQLSDEIITLNSRFTQNTLHFKFACKTIFKLAKLLSFTLAREFSEIYTGSGLVSKINRNTIY